MSDAVAGATGPHYYQEIFASPHKFDRLYLMNNRLMKSEDGGKTFVNMDETAKHGDNHAVAFKQSDPNYLLVGTDGGVYESFDLGASWRYMENLPLTQFYKVAVDDATPFYNVMAVHRTTAPKADLREPTITMVFAMPTGKWCLTGTVISRLPNPVTRYYVWSAAAGNPIPDRPEIRRSH
jgi:hypothetical protein